MSPEFCSHFTSDEFAGKQRSVPSASIEGTAYTEASYIVPQVTVLRRRAGLWSTMTGMSNSRIAQSLDESDLWSRTAADQILNRAEYGKIFRGLSAREQKRWRRRVATRLWRSFKQEVALKDGEAFAVQDVSEAVIDGVELWLDREWAVRR